MRTVYPLDAALFMHADLRHWLRCLFDRLPAVLPSACALCGAGANDGLCVNCSTQFFARHAARCTQCANLLPHAMAGTNMICGQCLKRPPAFDATVVATDYVPPVDQLVLALKFGGNLALAPLLSQWLREAVLWLQAGGGVLPALLVPVPLAAQRLAERGFNQSLEIARPLARSLGIPLQPQLAIRVRETPAQSLLSPKERQKNVRNAFTLDAGAIDHIRGQHVGVVDDVMTTGETLGELAATLKRFGAVRVTNLVFARAPH